MIPVSTDADANDASTAASSSTPSTSSTTASAASTPKEEVDLRSVDQTDLHVEVYPNEKDTSMVVWGEATRFHVKDLLGMGARFNPVLRFIGRKPGWVLSMKKKDEILAWYAKFQAGEIVADVDGSIQYLADKKAKREADSATRSKGISGLPTVGGRGGNSLFQIVTYKVYTPSVGAKVTLTVGDNKGDYIVESVSKSKGAIVECYIHPVDNKENKSKIVVHKNSWQVWGYNETHTIRFS